MNEDLVAKEPEIPHVDTGVANGPGSIVPRCSGSGQFIAEGGGDVPQDAERAAEAFSPAQVYLYGRAG